MAKTKEGSTIWQQLLFDCYNDDKTYLNLSNVTSVASLNISMI